MLLLLLQVRDQLCSLVCSMCGLMCDTFTDWEEHVAEVTAKEDSDHASLLTVQVSSNREKITPDSFKETIFKKWWCGECGRFFRTEEERDRHRGSLVTSVQLQCPQCGQTVTDMALHLTNHKKDVKCGECGDWCGDLNSHMLEVHAGYPSVLCLQTSSCAGDGTSVVTRNIYLKTPARFLAGEVKPIQSPSSERGGQSDKHPVRSYRNNDRDKALRPPDILPKQFFDSEGKRIWAKMPSNAHQCELCGFKAVTKNKYREKQDHMSKWHYSKRLEMIIPQNTKKPFLCPDCHYTGKDRQCVLRHYTGKHNVLEIWTNEFLTAINTKSLTPTIMYLVENVNFNAEAGSGEKFEIAKLNKPTALKQTEIFKCILCKDEPTFASRKGLALHVELAHAQSRAGTSEILQRNTGLDFSQSVETSGNRKREADQPVKRNGLTVIKKVKMSPLNILTRESEESLDLREIQDSGLVCVLCEKQEMAERKHVESDDDDEDDEDEVIPMQSITELNEHIRNVHSSLIIRSSFVLIRNTSASPEGKIFTYYLCTNCGTSFPPASRNKLELHVSQDCQNGNNNESVASREKTMIKSHIIDSIKRSNENLAKLLTEISPSITIIPKPSSSVDDNDIDDEDSLRKGGKNTRKEHCPCDYCRDPRLDLKLHKCYLDPSCDKTFSKVAHLKAHIRCHKNERPYQCEWPRCGKTFVRSDELRRHAWIHTREDRSGYWREIRELVNPRLIPESELV